jgi:hypothetical protein
MTPVLRNKQESSPPEFERHTEPPGGVAAIVSKEALEAAKRDPRVRAFQDRADAYLSEIDAQDRNT